ncbi:hypothetical protein Cni_G16430 [Canna indica]|uniref:C2H2-type domain-containing protein n=1 Tax=Canna indica TaxID=4628 RepID=A0AAQ3KF44_9LILI|nr:hypothetical protein Cni_G16430 [Canna indica]
MSSSSSPLNRFMEASTQSIVGEVEVNSEAEVVALSPETLLAASSFVCKVCDKEFRRDQNLQIHHHGQRKWRGRGGGCTSARSRVACTMTP